MPADRTRSPGANLRGAIMVQGTTSGAGKSTLVAGLCRLLHREGVDVVPFKPQNMANNSAVTIDGGEIGRAQALQAQAAGVAPHSDMNPVLLKPETDTRAQVIIQGRAHAAMDAREYHAFKPTALAAVMQSWQRLRERHDVIVVEGAGSPAEINLRDNDIANMGFAVAADCPVVLVADIDRGGVFAHLLGTLDCLSPGERERVKGFVINRFRGDLALLQPGIDWLVARTGKPVFGVLPMVDGLHLDAEDAIDTRQAPEQAGVQRLRIAVPVLPRISNHTDFDALRAHPQADIAFVGPGSPVPPCDLIILPGSKAVAADLDWLRREGWAAAILRHLRYGGKLIGICGGMQMLGRAIHDPLGLEGKPGSVPGLGLLEFGTTLEPEKRLERVSGTLLGAEVSGYEIHLGVTRGPALERAALQLPGRPEGALSTDGQILATYVHGLFDAPASCAALLAWAGVKDARGIDLDALRERSLERLADTLAGHLDLGALFARTLKPRAGIAPLPMET